MFRRRESLPFLQRVRSWFWPSSGWKRYGKYLLLRLQRLRGTPSELAGGVACGVAISFTPFVGFHFLLAAITAWFVRGNILASAFGTAAGNPWTFPFIWVSVLYTGKWFLGEPIGGGQVEFLVVFENAMRALMTFDLKMLAGDVWPIIWPMMVGCIPYYLVAWFVTFFLVKKSLEGLEKARLHRKKKREMKRLLKENQK